MIVTLRKTTTRGDILVEVRRSTGAKLFPARFDIAGIEAAARAFKRCKVSSSEVSALLLLIGVLSKKRAPAFITYRCDAGAAPI